MTWRQTLPWWIAGSALWLFACYLAGGFMIGYMAAVAGQFVWVNCAICRENVESGFLLWAAFCTILIGPPILGLIVIWAAQKRAGRNDAAKIVTRAL